MLFFMILMCNLMPLSEYTNLAMNMSRCVLYLGNHAAQILCSLAVMQIIVNMVASPKIGGAGPAVAGNLVRGVPSANTTRDGGNDSGIRIASLPVFLGLAQLNLYPRLGQASLHKAMKAKA